ncbi:hypothetical protein ColTof4_07378 [Colletotrichum tofieldiae]|uniref:Uncharacterized protein n=1 Tax=Colletotrichum tofieldiae TaxID=708197 RepID=A0A166U8V0_9PEZI|nr:hypothetical protein CT0861_11135 [Colletotrichum tofieldiae]GKT64986.1 hypothetical protein ColTof3_12325 [Colletotrichum tofieldiae]GKT74955.1 hypothetical protein ColTof4_07378 [Colletotrichum tofieldiae]GKT92171.1 hypothetical protein Ct61P_10021 [Colletotrichum tofieldiae]
MRYSQLILSLFLFFTFVIALPVPAPVEAVVARASSKKTSGNGNGSKKNTKAEVAGIDKNIAIQKQEKQDAKKVGKAEGTKNFDKTKGQLVSTIKSGEKVREDNQKKADPKNKDLVNGLKKVQGAQAKEEKQAKSLNNTPADKKTLSTLNSEFNKGIKVNEGNKKAAQNGGKKGKKGN